MVLLNLSMRCQQFKIAISNRFASKWDKYVHSTEQFDEKKRDWKWFGIELVVIENRFTQSNRKFSLNKHSFIYNIQIHGHIN